MGMATIRMEDQGSRRPRTAGEWGCPNACMEAVNGVCTLSSGPPAGKAGRVAYPVVGADDREARRR